MGGADREQLAPCRFKIEQMFGDSATFDFSPHHDSVELVFVDAAHDYHNALETFRRRHPELEVFHIEGTSLAYCRVHGEGAKLGAGDT